jgi:hypothetical protein
MLTYFRQSARKHGRLVWVGLWAGVFVIGAACLYIAYSCQACLEGETDTLRLTRIPTGCAEFRQPDLSEENRRDLPDGREEVFDHLAVRKSLSLQDTYFVAYATTIKQVYESLGSSSSPQEPRPRKNGPASPHENGRLCRLRRTSTAMKRAVASWDWPHRFEADEAGFHFHGKTFAKSRDYLLSGAPVISAGERRLTVLSGSGWFPRGGEVLSPDFTLEMIYHPARYFSVTTYDATSAQSVREIEGWGCYGVFSVRDTTTWFDDELLFVPAGEDRDLVCRY